jgi:anti-sigma factor RsiW
MPCPDEDTYARFVQGLLPDMHRSTIERHIDGCPRCTELAASFGRIYGAPPEPAPRPRDPAPRLALVEALMAAVHLAAAAVAPFVAFRAWMGVGCALAVAAAIGLGRRRRWGGALARVHALLAIPSVVLTPLAAYQLYELRRARREALESGAGPV